jgi:hypothetical protein
MGGWMNARARTARRRTICVIGGNGSQRGGQDHIAERFTVAMARPLPRRLHHKPGQLVAGQGEGRVGVQRGAQIVIGAGQIAGLLA